MACSQGPGESLTPSTVATGGAGTALVCGHTISGTVGKYVTVPHYYIFGFQTSFVCGFGRGIHNAR